MLSAVPNFARTRSMMTRSFGTFAALASSERISSRVGVAASGWVTENWYSTRWRSGFGRCSMILRSMVDLPILHLAEQLLDAGLRRSVDRHEGDPLTRDSVYNGGPDGQRLEERHDPEVLLSVDL